MSSSSPLAAAAASRANEVTLGQVDPLLSEWRQELLHSYTHVSDLVRHQLISESEARHLKGLGDQFKVRITPYYAKLMSPVSQDPNCPIRKQAIPDLGEEDPELPVWASQLSEEIYQRPVPWHSDSIGDLQNLAAPRLTHRYGNRAILHLSSLCAVYCRFCFRKAHLNQNEQLLYEGTLEPAFEYLSKNTEIRELILTGGDPLSVTDAVIEKLLKRITLLPHIVTLRIHSRMTVTLPSRINGSLLEILKRDWGFHITLVSHFNHPKEITTEARRALYSLRKAGITLLNQSVLLRSVNDSSDCLASLFQELYECGVIPFYLHHPDWTPGTFHFRPSIEKGKEIISELKGRISGPALPHYVLDIPQGFGKALIMSENFRKIREFPPESIKDRLSPTHSIGGTLYEVLAPHTRHEEKVRHTYLDLFSAE